MAPEGSGPQFSKLGPVTKMALQVDSSKFFHSERIEIDDKQYNDPIRITPQQNGVEERQNHTIMEMARSMLENKFVPYKYSKKAVHSSVYLLNRSPTKSVHKQTPEKSMVWTNTPSQ
jgi:hypothetical protein